MTSLRDAAQQALEALRLYKVCYGTSPAEEATLTALRVALAEPEQEPVAWMDREGDLYKMPEIEGWAPPHTMLYAAPHQRKPLTEETMRECAQAMDAEPLAEGWHELIKFARAIERAHGIGGQE